MEIVTASVKNKDTIANHIVCRFQKETWDHRGKGALERHLGTDTKILWQSKIEEGPLGKYPKGQKEAVTYDITKELLHKIWEEFGKQIDNKEVKKIQKEFAAKIAELGREI